MQVVSGLVWPCRSNSEVWQLSGSPKKENFPAGLHWHGFNITVHINFIFSTDTFFWCIYVALNVQTGNHRKTITNFWWLTDLLECCCPVLFQSWWGKREEGGIWDFPLTLELILSTVVSYLWYQRKTKWVLAPFLNSSGILQFTQISFHGLNALNMLTDNSRPEGRTEGRLQSWSLKDWALHRDVVSAVSSFPYLCYLTDF